MIFAAHLDSTDPERKNFVSEKVFAIFLHRWREIEAKLGAARSGWLAGWLAGFFFFFVQTHSNQNFVTLFKLGPA